jgi:hypothetical protein
MLERLLIEIGKAAVEELAKAILSHANPKAQAKALTAKAKVDATASKALAAKFRKRKGR